MGSHLSHPQVSGILLKLEGTILFLSAVISTAVSAADHQYAVIIIFSLSMLTFGLYFLLDQACILIKKVCDNPTITSIAVVLFYSITLIPFVSGEYFGIAKLAEMTSIYNILLLYFIGWMIFSFHPAIKLPTSNGRKMMDEIGNFRVFLSGTYSNHPKHTATTPITKEIYEKYLPYAIALDVEKEWGNRFIQQLSAAGIEVTSYQPYWWNGIGWNILYPADFGVLIDSNMNLYSGGGSPCIPV